MERFAVVGETLPAEDIDRYLISAIGWEINSLVENRGHLTSHWAAIVEERWSLTGSTKTNVQS
jgi:hypothetical protein